MQLLVCLFYIAFIIVSPANALLHNMPMSDASDPIKYEYDFRPEVGEAVDILPGVKWLRLPLPFLLGHIKVWLLQDGDGWAIADTGIFTSQTRDVWEDIFTGCLIMRRLRGYWSPICTRIMWVVQAGCASVLMLSYT